MKLVQILREITAAQAAANRARADAQYDAMQKSESKYKELAQAVQKETGLPTKSSDDTIYFPKKEIYSKEDMYYPNMKYPNFETICW